MNILHQTSILALAAAYPVLAGPLSSPASSPATSPAPIPSFFAENRGQVEPDVRFLMKRSGVTAYFRDRDVQVFTGDRAMTISLIGSSAHPSIAGRGPLSGTANFFIGNDSSHWRSDVPVFEEIVYREAWPGVDMVYATKSARLKSEFVVKPGANPSAIRWSYGAGARVAVDRDGALEVNVAEQAYTEGAPEIYQDIDGQHIPVNGSYEISPDGVVSFRLGQYNREAELVIDPVISYSTFLGGNSQDNATAIATDSFGNMVVAGWTSSSTFPTTAGARAFGGSVDAFVAKIGGNGSRLLFCTYLGGNGDDRAFGLALDSGGNIYLTGRTGSANFPVTAAVQQRYGGAKDAFVTKLNPTANQIIYSTYLGGSDMDSGNAIAVDAAGNAYVTGDTLSTNFPALNGYSSVNQGGQDIFVSKLNPAGTVLFYSSYLGGHGNDHASAIAIDTLGDAYITGSTLSPDFPSIRGPQPVTGGNEDAFVTEISVGGNALIFSTFLGGSGGTPGLPEEGRAIVLDAARNIYVSGVTSSLNFPVTSAALQPNYSGGNTDGFLAKFAPSGTALSYASFLGGSGLDSVNAMAIDAFQYVTIVGYTSSEDFPNVRAVQAANHGQFDAFVTKFNFLGAAPTLVNSTYFGGMGADSATAVALDKFGNALIAGYTSSSDLHIHNALQPYNYGAANAFAVKISNSWIPVSMQYGQTGNTWQFDIGRDNLTDGQNYTGFSPFFGGPGDIPVVGDWNGSGTLKCGVYRGGIWYLDWDGNGQWDINVDHILSFGGPNDTPIVGDWTGDGKIKAGLFRGGWFMYDLAGHLQNSPTGMQDRYSYINAPTGVPVVGDWNGTGWTKVGIFLDGNWILDYNGNMTQDAGDKTFVMGQHGDIPITGDWDGSGISHPGVIRNGAYYLSYQWGNEPGGLRTALPELTFTFGSPSNHLLIGAATAQ